MSDALQKGRFSVTYDRDELRHLGSWNGQRNQSPGWLCAQLSTSTLCGIVFGFALEKSRVVEPQLIIDQMNFSRLVLLKIFVTGSAASMFSFSILSMVPATHKLLVRSTRTFTADLVNKGFCSSVVGGAILGTGMALCGSFPGIVLTQIGAGVKNAAFTLLGGLCGVTLYGLADPLILKVTKPRQIENHFVHQHLGTPFFMMALPCVAMIGMKTFAMELYAPWTSEVSTGGEGIVHCLSWPPFIVGTLIGLLHIPLVVISCDISDCSSSYCTVMSQVFRLCPYLAKYWSGIHDFGRVLFMGGAMLGGYASAQLSCAVPGSSEISPLVSFLGGVCMLFGSRLCGGSTSYHGLTGTGLISVLSTTTMCAVFAGGLATAYFMKKSCLDFPSKTTVKESSDSPRKVSLRWSQHEVGIRKIQNINFNPLSKAGIFE